MDDKKLNEIRTRKEEIRNLLESDDKELNLEELRSEIETLNKEEKEIEERMSIANKINNNEIISKKIETNEVNKTMDNKLESIEYRNAFRKFIMSGEMDEEFRSVSLVANNQAIVPQVVLDKIVEKIENYGNVIPEVTKTTFPAGFQVAVSQLAGPANWINEATLSTTGVTIDAKTTTPLTFNAYGLAKAIGLSFFAQVETLPAFEAKVAENVGTAMAMAIENAIVVGDGSSKPTGIFADAATTTNVVNLAASLKYKDLINVIKGMPAAYRANSVLLMNEDTFFELYGITDTAGQAVCRVNVGIDNKPMYNILGTRVLVTDFAPSFASAATGDIVAVGVKLSDYILNVAHAPDLVRYEEPATRNVILQSISLLDGKLADKNSLLAVKKG